MPARADELELLARAGALHLLLPLPAGGRDDEARLDALNDADPPRRPCPRPHGDVGTRVDGRFAIRPCFINPRTTLADADALVDEVLAVGRELSAPG